MPSLPDVAPPVRDAALPDVTAQPRDMQVAFMDDSRYHFEAGEQGWMDLRTNGTTGIRKSTLQAFKGQASLEVALNLTAGGERFVGTAGGNLVPPGAKVTFRVYLPGGHKLVYVQPLFLYFPSPNDNSVWHGEPAYYYQLQSGWNTLTLTAPVVAHSVIELGVQFKSADGWTGKVYIDSVSW